MGGLQWKSNAYLAVIGGLIKEYEVLYSGVKFPATSLLEASVQPQESDRHDTTGMVSVQSRVS